MALAGALAALTVGCYATPKPNCAFRCGADGDCPADYACNPNDNVCHLIVGSTLAECEAVAAPDSPISADAPISPDARPTSTADAPPTSTTPDAPPVSEPDAPPVSEPDAPIVPDAPPPPPDAPPPPPDAAPDVDAAPDA
jgi:hypothetical protein